MTNNYISDFENIISFTLYTTFKIVLIFLVALLVLSLIMLIIGCLIKSQKIKSKFLKVVPSLILSIIFLLSLPIFFLKFKKLF